MKLYYIEGRLRSVAYSFSLNKISFETDRKQDDLRTKENRIFERYKGAAAVALETPEEVAITMYPVYGSLPFFLPEDRNNERLIFEKLRVYKLLLYDYLTSDKYKRRVEGDRFLVYRPTIPIGNLNPEQVDYLIIGEAPGVGNGEQLTVDRVMVYGPSSMLLRKSIPLVVWQNAWITNLLKTSIASNRKAPFSTFELEKNLFVREVATFAYKAKKVLVLGKRAKEVFDTFYKNLFKNKQIFPNTPEIIYSYHPTYFFRNGNTVTNHYINRLGLADIEIDNISEFLNRETE